MDTPIAAVLPATPQGPAGAEPTATPDSDTGRAFRALLGRHQGAGPKAPSPGRADARATAAPDADDTATAETDPADAARAERGESDALQDPALQHLLPPTAPEAATTAAVPAPGTPPAPLPAASADPANPSPAADAPATDAKAAAPSPADGRPLALPVDGSQPTASAGAASTAGADTTPGRVAPLATPRHAGPAHRATVGDTAPAAPGTAAATATSTAADTPSFAAALADARGPRESRLPAEPPAVAATPQSPGLALHGVAFTEHRPAEAPVAAAAAATIVAPPDSPEFPGAFGLQIATFARDGIEHAELTLNPAEMGPVAVQIALDGTQARVELRADVAATRDALQQSLPALAASLREAGLTLAGGSVSAHAGQGGGARRDAGGDEGRGTGRAARAAGPLAAVAAPVRRTARLGGVDLYA